ncbi:NAD-dependent epimerase/dehydratase family protein [Lichenicoccus sp.]|uniref:NAD-dependent epimerase/dehydratase family protein n=1 Tax=Lichenicoccus sp. TaxID=2781899 RepID=UPI003D108F4D
MMNHAILVLGHGPVGRLVAGALAARGEAVCVAQRSRPAVLAPGIRFVPCDTLDEAAVRSAAAGAAQVVLAIGFPYDSRVWRTAWPRAMRNVIGACEAAGARLVFIDNLYQLGPQHGVRNEDTPLSDAGEKPAILSQVARIWMAASDRVQVAALRCPDFYGPGVTASHIGATGFGRIARGKAAFLLAPPDTPHDFAYVPDIARAALTLLDAPDDAFGQVWNMPCARVRTPRQILRLGADAIGRRLRINAVPLRLLPLLGRFSRTLHEVADVGFTWDRAYHVDAGKFCARFWSDVTPFEIGAPASARWFVDAAVRRIGN